MDELLAKVTELQELDDGSVQVTMVLTPDAIGRIKSSQVYFHDTMPLPAKIGEMMTVAICRFAKTRI
jgi:hypothetical protein